MPLSRDEKEEIRQIVAAEIQAVLRHEMAQWWAESVVALAMARPGATGQFEAQGAGGQQMQGQGQMQELEAQGQGQAQGQGSWAVDPQALMTLPSQLQGGGQGAGFKTPVRPKPMGTQYPGVGAQRGGQGGWQGAAQGGTGGGGQQHGGGQSGNGAGLDMMRMAQDMIEAQSRLAEQLEKSLRRLDDVVAETNEAAGRLRSAVKRAAIRR